MFSIIEGLKNLYHAKLASFLVILSIGAALLIGGWFLHVTFRLKSTSAFAEKALEVEAFLVDNLPGDAVDSLRAAFERNHAFTDVRFISKDSAAAIFLAEVGEDIRTLTGENPLPPSFRLNVGSEYLRYGVFDSLVGAVGSMPGVDEVTARREYLLALLKYRRMIWAVHISAGVLILGIALLLIVNVIKLSIHSRKKSIEVMKLVGATNRFIRRPFIVEGFFDGIIGGGAGCALSYGSIIWFGYLLDIHIAAPAYFYPAMVGAGGCLGIAGSIAAVRKYLKAP